MSEKRSSKKGSQEPSKKSSQRVPLMLQPLKPLPGETPREFGERSLLEIKRGLIERLRLQEQNRE